MKLNGKTLKHGAILGLLLILAGHQASCLVSAVEGCRQADPFCNPASTALFLNEGALDTERLRFLILDDASNNFLEVYRFDDDVPTLVSSLALGLGPNRLALHPEKIFLYSANSSQTDSYELDHESGTLTRIDSDSGGGHGNQVIVSPNGNFVYTGDFAGVVNAHAVTSGTIEFISSSAPGNALSSFQFTPDGTVFVATQAGGPDNVTPATADTNAGSLGAGSAFTMGGGDGPVVAPVAPNGAYVFALAGGASKVEALRLDSGPAFTSVDQKTGSGNYNAGDLTPDGKYLYAGTSTGSIDRYSVDTSVGSVSLLGTDSSGATSITGARVDPTGAYLFLTTSGPFQLLQYAIASDGTLSLSHAVSTGYLSNVPVIAAY